MPSEFVILSGQAVGQLGVTERRTPGLCAVPEERNGHAVVSEFSLHDTSRSPDVHRHGAGQRRPDRPGQGRKIMPPSYPRLYGQGDGTVLLLAPLSGGNLQNFIMAPEIWSVPRRCRLRADLGSRCGRGGGHRSGDRRSRCAWLGGRPRLPRTSTSFCLGSDMIVVINLGRLSEPMKVGEASIEEIGLLMVVDGDLFGHGRYHGAVACASGREAGLRRSRFMLVVMLWPPRGAAERRRSACDLRAARL